MATICYGDAMPRKQTLVQLTDDLVDALDRRAAAVGITRSALIRDLLRVALAEDLHDRLAAEIKAGYAAAPQFDARDAWGDLDEWTATNSRRNLGALREEEDSSW